MGTEIPHQTIQILLLWPSQFYEEKISHCCDNDEKQTHSLKLFAHTSSEVVITILSSSEMTVVCYDINSRYLMRFKFCTELAITSQDVC